jgi:molecular chaperone GrpE (heat shock protein)
MSEMTDQNAADTPPTVEAQAEAESAESASLEISLETQLEEARRKADEYLNGWKRTLADFENYRKRIEKEREEIAQNVTVETLRRLLPIVDDFERALEMLPAEKAEDETLKGFVLIHRKLLSVLESANLTQIDPKGTSLRSDAPRGDWTRAEQRSCQRTRQRSAAERLPARRSRDPSCFGARGGIAAWARQCKI